MKGKTSCHILRSNSIVSRSGRRIVKNPSRVGDIVEGEETLQAKVPLFRLNSFIKDTGKNEDVGEEPERQQWDNPMEFLMSCISMSVGLVNVWRFPFTAYENGGGAFLIPYMVVLLLGECEALGNETDPLLELLSHLKVTLSVGRPLYFMELALGQFSSSGSVRVWDMVPALGGVGYGQVGQYQYQNQCQYQCQYSCQYQY